MAKKKVRGLRVKNMHDIIDYAISSRRFVGGLGRIKKNGKIKKLNGQVFARKTSRSGNEYILIDNFLNNARNGAKKRWQMVLLKNLVEFNENNWTHSNKKNA